MQRVIWEWIFHLPEAWCQVSSSPPNLLHDLMNYVYEIFLIEKYYYFDIKINKWLPQFKYVVNEYKRCRNSLAILNIINHNFKRC